MRALKYSDISLKPNFGVCESRSECSTKTSILGNDYKLPIVPANMKAVVTEDLCKWLSENGYFYIMHRFDVDNVGFVDRANREDWNLVSISLGVQQDDVDTLSKLKRNDDRGRVHCITIDIAHGHCQKMKEMLGHCKRTLPSAKIIAGNVATPNAVADLYSWGADMVKVGIGQGSPCTTKDKTGFTMPMFSCVKNCSNVYSGNLFSDSDEPQKVPIIADGGIKCNGDVAKALVAGADAVMAGGLFASCSDSPSHSIEIGGVTHKAYYGSASFENKKTNTHIEGVLRNVPSSGMTYEAKLIELGEDIRSSISYAGGTDLSSLNNKNVEYVEL